MFRVLVIAAALFTLAPPVQSSDAALALADRAAFPVERQPYLYYASCEQLDQRWHAKAATALKLVIPSLSRQPILEQCLPVQVGPTLWRLDLSPIEHGGLGWDLGAWQDVVKAYPYRLGTVDELGRRHSLVYRVDWLLLELTDAHESNAYYRLLFGEPAPKTRDEALERLAVDRSGKEEFGQIEGKSGVSVAGVRLIRNLPVGRGFAWGTADTIELTAERDPLEQPENDAPHDGEEWIIGLRKQHLATGAMGALQVYFLANGQGTIVDRAPVDLVEDHTRFRGLAEIRNAGSCIACHGSVLNPFTRNDLRETLASGVAAYAYDDDRQRIEAFHLADLTREIERNNQDVETIVQQACGCSAAAASAAYVATVKFYDEPLYINRAAHELGVHPDTLRSALAYASSQGQRMGARIASLAHSGGVSRDAWEENYLAVEALCQQWENSQ